MKNLKKKYYDFDKGYIVKEKPKKSKNLLNANYHDIIRKKNKINKNDMYSHSLHKTDIYYEKLYNDKSNELEYKIDDTVIYLSYSEKINKWKEIINK